MQSPIKIYIADSDELAVNKLKAIINRVMPNQQLYVAKNGLEAWEMIKRQEARFIIFSAVDLPVIDGFTLLKQMKSSEKIKGNYFIMCTEHEEQDINLKALSTGADDFITKPIALDALLAKIKLIFKIINTENALKTKEAVAQAKAEADLSKTKQAIDTIVKYENAHIPGFSSFAEKIEEAAMWIAPKLGMEDEKSLEALRNACRLAYVGRLALPEKLVLNRIAKDGIGTNEELMQVPTDAYNCVVALNGMEETADILGSIYENFDGSGFPNKKLGVAIPLGARIMRVVLDFFEGINGDRKRTNSVLEAIEHRINKLYDLKVVALLDQFTAFKDYSAILGRERDIEVHELVEGLHITRNVYTESGFKLIGSGVTLTQEMVDKIREILRNDSVIGKIWIRMR